MLHPAMPVWICLLSLAVCVIVHTVTRFTSLSVLISKSRAGNELLFYIRDIREGLGERELFRNDPAYRQNRPESARKNIALISEYGRFDDLMCLMGTPSEKAVVELIRTQLNQDCEALKERKSRKYQRTYFTSCQMASFHQYLKCP